MLRDSFVKSVCGLKFVTMQKNLGIRCLIIKVERLITLKKMLVWVAIGMTR